MPLCGGTPQPVHAADTEVTGGTYGASCNSGGYFTPSAVTVNSGDTITFTVPSNDPYAGGLQIHGFPEGNFTVLPGDSHTTAALTANVSYYGTWPNTGCPKGSGTVKVTQPNPPVSPPSTPPTLTSSGSSTTTTATTKTDTAASGNKTVATAGTTKTSATTPTANQPTQSSTTTSTASTTTNSTGSPKPSSKIADTPTTDTILGMNKTAATVGIPIVSVVVITAAIFGLRYLLFTRRLAVGSTSQPLPGASPTPESAGSSSNRGTDSGGPQPPSSS